MRATALLFAAGAAAQTTGNLTVSFFNLFGWETLAASVIAASPYPGPTTYLLACGDPGSGLACSDSYQHILTAGPSTFAYTIPVDPESVTIPILSAVVACEIENTTKAQCTRPNDAEEWDHGKVVSKTNTATATVEPLSGESIRSMWGPIVVTAGQEKLAAANDQAEVTTATATTAAVATTASESAGSAALSSSGAVASRTGKFEKMLWEARFWLTRLQMGVFRVLPPRRRRPAGLPSSSCPLPREVSWLPFCYFAIRVKRVTWCFSNPRGTYFLVST